MARKTGSVIGSIFFLQLVLGVFFLVLGISDLSNHDSELRQVFGRNETLSIVTAVVELVMGAALVLGLFMSVSADMTRFFSIALFILWGVYMVVAFIVQGFLQPSFLTWLYRLSWHAIILISLWIVGRRYA